MAKKMRNINKSRAWRILRIALLWVRKGGVLKNRLILAKHLMKNIKNSTHFHHFCLHRGGGAAAIGYGERELSFDETPVIHVRMHRPSSLRFKLPNIPCINPPAVDFNCDFEDEEFEQYGYGGDGEEEKGEVREEESESSESDEEIDSKAEEFIENFYKQMKLQRQISYLQYNEMINRGAN